MRTKTVYFRDYPAPGPTRSGLTIPFSKSDDGLLQDIAPLSSLRLRKILGFDSYRKLEAAAAGAGKPVATFARDHLAAYLGKQGGRSLDEAKGLQATFRGGHGSPLHEWYPYLEGYSPRFVEGVIDRYAPDAKSVLDPFCGSGTTALVAAKLGLSAYYAEVNPVCRFIIDAKMAAVSLSYDDRTTVVSELRHVADHLDSILMNTDCSEALDIRLTTSLGPRPVFDPETRKIVLKLRTMVDVLASKSPHAAQFLIVAVLRSLVPSSLMVRRGDLRFRTEAELRRFTPALISDLVDGILMIASDLEDVSIAPGSSTLVCENATQIGSALSVQVDAVITSPPYLNGTNYFRNTKLELCFLGHLSRREDLRRFRDEAITSGINDVTRKKTNSGIGNALPSSLRSVIAELDKSAYDQRIPAMVQSYFQEMRVVLANLGQVTRTGGTVSIDLGDSCYGQVHVPTDVILAEMIEEYGFQPVETVVLRERQSRDGRRLSQTLQTFRKVAR